MTIQKKTFSANTILSIDQSALIVKTLAPKGWVTEHTAFLIIHGIGNQNPLETLDSFGRGFIHAYADEIHCPLSAFVVTHEVAVKPDSGGGVWFDNFVRISKSGEEAHIDLYEYYWANQTQDKASLHQIQVWVSDVVRQAKNFMKRM